MKTQHIFAISGLALALGLSQPASATVTFDFDADGSGGGAFAPTTYAFIDQLPGNALGVGAVTAVQNFVLGAGTTDFQLNYQANLNTVGGINPAFVNGTGGQFFTFEMSFGETVTSVLGNTATFGFNPGAATNFFNIYVQGAAGDDLNGTGFGAGTGTLVLSAHVASVTSSNFVNNGGSTTLDNFLADDWAGQQSVSGGGATDLVLQVDSTPGGYFPDLLQAGFITISFINTSQILPYNQVDPSFVVVGAASNIGTINGQDGPDLLFQADANQSFDRVVPEIDALAGTGALTILGGMLALVGERRRRRV